MLVSSDLRPYDLDTRVKSGAELSTDHHLVVSWVRWKGKLLDRPGKPKHVVRVNWERLDEAPMFKASIADAAAGSCGLKVMGTSRGGNPQTPWWTPVVREAI